MSSLLVEGLSQRFFRQMKCVGLTTNTNEAEKSSFVGQPVVGLPFRFVSKLETCLMRMGFIERDGSPQAQADLPR